MNNYTARLALSLTTNIKHCVAYLRYSAPKVDPIRLRLAQKPNKHTRTQSRKRHLAHKFTMERPKLRRAIRRHIVRLHNIQARITTNLAQQYRPTAIRIRARRVSTHVGASGGRAACG